MSFSYLAKESLDRLDLETVHEGDRVSLRRKSTQEGFGLAEEKKLFMELFEKHGVEIRAQFQHDGFWGTSPRNDMYEDGKPKRGNYVLPQCPDDYESNKRKGLKPSIDTWPRMYTKEWLEHE